MGVFGDRTMAAKCLVFLASPAITFRVEHFGTERIIYVALLSVIIFMAAAMTARVVLVAYIIFMLFDAHH